MLDNLFVNNTIIGAAMQASVLRNEIIMNNIANVDVPNFKKSVVEFESILNKELNKAKEEGQLNINKLLPEVRIKNEENKYRLDGNNVDIEIEMVDLYTNSTRYDSMVSSIINNNKRINSIFVK